MTDLNHRETEILRLVSEGKSYKRISSEIDLAVVTIKFYIRSAKDKLGASSIGQAVAIFVKL